MGIHLRPACLPAALPIPGSEAPHNFYHAAGGVLAFGPGTSHQLISVMLPSTCTTRTSKPMMAYSIFSSEEMIGLIMTDRLRDREAIVYLNLREMLKLKSPTNHIL